jgi:RNA polymerase sigma factor for flagellar operon FliA
LRAASLEAAAAGADSSSLEQRLIESLPLIDRVVRAIGRRYRLTRDECDELRGFVRLKLIEDDYAVLRRFEGRSRLSTYLATVIRRLFLDERVKAWGRWRQSAQAVRLGPMAIALERLIERQHLSVEQAIETLCAADPRAREEDLRALAAQLPRRTGRHFVDDSVLVRVPAPGPGADARVEQLAGRQLRGLVTEALRGVTAALPPRARLLLRLRFVQGTSVADVSRTLGCDQKPLYREIDRALAQLRHGLEARGISSSHVRALIAAGTLQTDGLMVQ